MKRNRRDGFSLLEVVLAMAILVGALAALGELLGLGTRHAREAADLTTAQLLCESKLAEIVAGILPPSAVAGAPCENDPEWLYTVLVEPTDEPGLLAVQVTVTENQPTLQPIEFSLTRWLPDPDYLAELQVQQDQTSAASSSTGGASSTGGGT
jgi:type II secretion system protein I